MTYTASSSIEQIFIDNLFQININKLQVMFYAGNFDWKFKIDHLIKTFVGYLFCF